IAKDELLVVNGLQRARPGSTVDPEQSDPKTEVAEKLSDSPVDSSKSATKPLDEETAQATTSDSKPSASEVGSEKLPAMKTLSAEVKSVEVPPARDDQAAATLEAAVPET